MEEIYGVDYNSSIYQFTILTGNQGENSTTIIEVTLKSLTGLDGSAINASGLLGLSLLSSSSELCATFFFLWTGGVKNYFLSLSLYAEPRNAVYMKAFMSLPNQARGFEKFELFDSSQGLGLGQGLPEKKLYRVEFLVTSLKFLQKRTTAAEPCIDVDNYDKVSEFLYSSITFLFGGYMPPFWYIFFVTLNRQWWETLYYCNTMFSINVPVVNMGQNQWILIEEYSTMRGV